MISEEFPSKTKNSFISFKNIEHSMPFGVPVFHQSHHHHHHPLLMKISAIVVVLHAYIEDWRVPHFLAEVIPISLCKSRQEITWEKRTLGFLFGFEDETPFLMLMAVGCFLLPWWCWWRWRSCRELTLSPRTRTLPPPLRGSLCPSHLLPRSLGPCTWNSSSPIVSLQSS